MPSLPAPLPSLTLDELWQQLQAERAGRVAAEAEAARLRFTARIPERNPNPILRLGPGGELLFANPAAAFLIPELTDKTSWVRRQLLEAVAAVLASGQSERHEIVVSQQQFLLFAVPVVAEKHAMLYLTDITALRQAETQVLEQQAFYETLLEHLPAVVVVLGPDQRYRFLNAYAAPDPVVRQARVGTSFADHAAALGLPRRFVTRRRRMFERAISTRTLVAWEEQWPATATEPVHYWQCYYQPVFDAIGHLHLMMCYGLNVTHQRQAEARSRTSEAAVRQQQDFIRQVLDLNPNMIYVRDAARQFIFRNRATLELHQLIMALAGTEATLADAVAADELRSYETTDLLVLNEGRELQIQERLTLATGEMRWYQSVKRPLTLPNGTTHLLGVSTDITALKAAQHAAEAAAVARENFLANMSHEIRTPLNGVLGMAALLGKTSLTAQQRNYVDVVLNSGRHLLSVVNDVLDMAKITSGHLEMEKISFNLCDSMGLAVQPLIALAQEKGITVEGVQLRASCPYPWVLGDPHRLNQILLNLVSNAIKFTPAGGKVNIGGYYVSETADTLTTEWRVTDTGIGISPDKQEAIFQEFTQAYADTSRQFGGTGLGLSISRALVKQLGGTLTVKSQVGEGSTFIFTLALPKAPVDARAEAPARAVPAATVRGRRVLLVEDNAVNREVAQLLLEGNGVLVDTAADGVEALAAFANTTYDVVLMDIQMPGMNGLKATARIRQHPDPARAATPILALTANAFKADAEKYRAAGMDDTLSKPFDEAELLAKLAGLIGGSTAPVEAPHAPPPQPANPPLHQPATPLIRQSTTAQPYDLALLRQTAHGNAAFITRILSSFHANTPTALNELWDAIGTDNMPAAAALAHKLRPSLQLVGAAALLPLMARLEDTEAPLVVRAVAAEKLAEGLEELLAALPQE